MSTLDTTRYVMLPVAGDTSWPGGFRSPNDLASLDYLNSPLSDPLTSSDQANVALGIANESLKLSTESAFDSMTRQQEAVLLKRQQELDSLSDTRVSLIGADTKTLAGQIEKLDQSS